MQAGPGNEFGANFSASVCLLRWLCVRVMWFGLMLKPNQTKTKWKILRAALSALQRILEIFDCWHIDIKSSLWVRLQQACVVAFSACRKLGTRRNKQIMAVKRGGMVYLLSHCHVLMHLFPWKCTSHSIINMHSQETSRYWM
jgi:hypothetical protein